MFEWSSDKEPSTCCKTKVYGIDVGAIANGLLINKYIKDTMSEWSDEFNSFNSLKILCWKDELLSILDGKIPKPVSATVDGTNLCNLNCSFCHYAKFRNEKPEVIENSRLLRLPFILSELGVKSICYSGGGEPLMHPKCGEFIRKTKDYGIDVGIITNGLLINKYIKDILYSCRWMGISVDSSNEKLYHKMKGGSANDFYKLKKNIKSIIRKRKDPNSPSVGFKFLIHPDNYHDIINAAKLAKSLGVDMFHARPYYGDVSFTNKQIRISLENIKLSRSMLEDDKFKVYGITHKFDSCFRKKIVPKCEVTPIAGLTFAADGYCYVCCDLRGENMGKLCEWEEILDVWGSEKHKRIIDNIKPDKCPHRCTYNAYQIILDEVFKKDKMTYKFP